MEEDVLRFVAFAKERRLDFRLDANLGDALYIEDARDRISSCLLASLAKGTTLDRSRTQVYVYVLLVIEPRDRVTTRSTMLHRCDDKPYLSVSGNSVVPGKCATIRVGSRNSCPASWKFRVFTKAREPLYVRFILDVFSGAYVHV